MMKQSFALLLLSLCLLLAGCIAVNSSPSNSGTNGSKDIINSSNSCGISDDCNVSSSPKVDKVEVIHFHGTHQCYSCLTVGQYAEETVNTYFADELKSRRISFAHINAELPENQEIVRKYGVVSASLWTGFMMTKDSIKKRILTSGTK